MKHWLRIKENSSTGMKKLHLGYIKLFLIFLFKPFFLILNTCLISIQHRFSNKSPGKDVVTFPQLVGQGHPRNLQNNTGYSYHIWAATRT